MGRHRITDIDESAGTEACLYNPRGVDTAGVKGCRRITSRPVASNGQDVALDDGKYVHKASALCRRRSDVILPAFAAAGAEPWLEGNSEPGYVETGGAAGTGSAAGTGGSDSGIAGTAATAGATSDNGTGGAAGVSTTDTGAIDCVGSPPAAGVALVERRATGDGGLAFLLLLQRCSGSGVGVAA